MKIVTICIALVLSLLGYSQAGKDTIFFSNGSVVVGKLNKIKLGRFAFLNDVPHLLVINEASLLIDSNPFAPLNAFLLMIAQLMARTVAPIPPPILEPNTLPVTLTRINKMKEDNEPANARARVPIAINTTTISRARHRNNIPLPVPNPEK